MSRTPVKGKPDFSIFNDERVKSFEDFIQQMIYAYKYCSPEKTAVLEEIWKDLSIECANRVGKNTHKTTKSAEKDSSSLRKAPKLRKSPMKN